MYKLNFAGNHWSGFPYLKSSVAASDPSLRLNDENLMQLEEGTSSSIIDQHLTRNLTTATSFWAPRRNSSSGWAAVAPSYEALEQYNYPTGRRGQPSLQRLPEAQASDESGTCLETRDSVFNFKRTL